MGLPCPSPLAWARSCSLPRLLLWGYKCNHQLGSQQCFLFHFLQSYRLYCLLTVESWWRHHPDKPTPSLLREIHGLFWYIPALIGRWLWSLAFSAHGTMQLSLTSNKCVDAQRPLSELSHFEVNATKDDELLRVETNVSKTLHLSSTVGLWKAMDWLPVTKILWTTHSRWPVVWGT